MTRSEIKSIEVVTYPDGRMDTRNSSLYSGLSEKTMAMQRCNGTGPKFIKRGRVFYFQSDIDEWMNANGRMTSTAQTKHAAPELATADPKPARPEPPVRPSPAGESADRTDTTPQKPR
jgi:hypothetical protein